MSAITCPNWCTSGSGTRPCEGGHRTASDQGYMSASANIIPRSGLALDGYEVPRVDVGLAWPEAWGEAVSVWVHSLSSEHDASIDFTVAEALQFYAAFGDMLARAFMAGARPGMFLSREEVAALFYDIAAPRRALGVEEVTQ